MALLFAGSIMSFKLWEKKSAPITYFYNSILHGAFANTSHWQTTNAGM
jgi:hypothetical protein